jgi:hypothetical protein
MAPGGGQSGPDGSTVRCRREQWRSAWRGGVARRQQAKGTWHVVEKPASMPGGEFEVHWGVQMDVDGVHRTLVASGALRQRAGKGEMKVGAYLQFLKVQRPLGKLQFSLISGAQMKTC